MAVTIRLMLQSLASGRSLETVALANAGYRAEVVEIALPIWAARGLKLYPPPKPTMREVYLSASGRFTVTRLRDSVSVKAIAEGREVGPVSADAILVKGLDEVLMSDRLISALKIELTDVGEGLWRFRDDAPNVVRRSERP